MKKLICILLCIALMFTVSACGKKPSSSGDSDSLVFDGPVNREDYDMTGTLTIKTMNKGYGVKGLNAIKDAYIEMHPETTITISEESDISAIAAQELPLYDDNETDLYFGAGINFAELYMDQLLDNNGASSLLLDLTSYLENWPTYDDQMMMGEAVDANLINMLSIADKKDASVKRTFALPWAGSACGLIYNTEIFAEVYGGEDKVVIPETTNDLMELINKIMEYNKANKSKPGFVPITPIIYPGENAMSYWQYLTYVWWAQYEGFDQFMKYWTLADDDLFDPNPDYFKQEGQLKALEAIEQLIKGDHVYKGSAKLNDKVCETMFVKYDDPSITERFAMTVNGDWFLNEAEAAVGGGELPPVFAMMKTPKLSAAVEKHGNSPVNVSDYAYSLASTHNAFIPSYSAEKFIALDFLSFYFSEEGAKIFYDEVGTMLPRSNYSYITQKDINKMNPFVKSQYDIIKATNFVYSSNQLSPVRYMGGMPIIPDGMMVPEGMLVNQNKTAAQAWQEYNDHFTAHWSEYTELLG